jgi:flagellar hook-associated protein 2
VATITSLGIGSGIDINSMVTQLVAVESRPIAQLQTAATRLNTQVSALGRMQSLLSAVQDAATALSGASLWTRSTATSADERVVSIVGGSNATPGNYAVSVQSLAAPQTADTSANFADANALVGSGTLTIELGRWDSGLTQFDPKAGASAVNLVITASDTLATLRDRINAAGAGVSASIVSDANGTRLALRGNEGGAVNGFRIGVIDDDLGDTDGNGLSRLAFDPPAGANQLQYRQPASNASATINGIPIETTSNDVSGVVEGLTFRLRQQSVGTVDVSVASDREAVKKAVQTFADAYNELARYITEQTRYDPATRSGGPLQGDSAVSGLLGRLRGALNEPSGASARFARLSDIGLQLQRDGTLAVNAGQLDSATADLAELKRAFANSDSALPANNGFARRYAELATQALGVDGSLTTRSEGLRKLISRNQEQQERMEDRVERFRERLVAQFSAMDSNLSRLNALQSYVTTQLAALQKGSEG